MELAERVRAGDTEARDELVKANLRFVVTIALKYQRWLPLFELISAGNLGLVTAAERFDTTRGNKFITYAVWWVRQSILQTIADQSHLIRLPMNQVGLLREMCRVARRLGQENARADEMEALVGELAEELEVPVERAVDVLRSNDMVCSLHEEFQDRGGDGLLAVLPDVNQEPPDAEAIRNSNRALLDSVLDGLEARERYILRLYFGLDTGVPLNLQDLIGVSRERVRQLKVFALGKLKHARRLRILRRLQE